MSNDDDANVSLESIDNDRDIPIEKGKHDTSELDHLSHEQETFKNELGWLGRLFGGRKEKPGNISGLVIIACFCLLTLVYLKPLSVDSGMSSERIFSGLASIATLILGYLFGSNDRS